MPKKLEKLEKKIEKNVKPRKGETKEQAAYAIANSILNKNKAKKKK